MGELPSTVATFKQSSKEVGFYTLIIGKASILP